MVANTALVDGKMNNVLVSCVCVFVIVSWFRACSCAHCNPPICCKRKLALQKIQLLETGVVDVLRFTPLVVPVAKPARIAPRLFVAKGNWRGKKYDFWQPVLLTTVALFASLIVLTFAFPLSQLLRVLS